MLAATLFAQQKCHGEYQVVLQKGDTITVKCKKMVYMNPETFAAYYHNTKQLEELREEVPKWVDIIDSLNTEHKMNKVELDSIISIRHEQVMLERESKEQVIDDLIKSETINARLRRKNKFLKFFSLGGSSLSAILLVILL